MLLPVINVDVYLMQSFLNLKALGKQSAAKVFVADDSPLYPDFLSAYESHTQALISCPASGHSAEIVNLNKVPTAQGGFVVLIDPVFVHEEDIQEEPQIEAGDRRAAIAAAKASRNKPL